MVAMPAMPTNMARRCTFSATTFEYSVNVVHKSQIVRYSVKNVTMCSPSGPWCASPCSWCASWLTATTTTRSKNSSSQLACRSAVAGAGSVMWGRLAAVGYGHLP
jgi:hypothetical protein